MKPQSHKPGVKTHANNPSTGKMEKAENQKVQVYPWVYNDFEAILS